MKKILLSVEGMTCFACSNGLEKYLNKQKGIFEAHVNLVLSNVTILYDEKLVKKSSLEEYIKKAGFQSLGEFKEIRKETKGKKEKKIFYFFTILAGFLMYITMFLPPFFKENKEGIILYKSILFFLALLFLIYGRDILKNGYKNLIHKTPNMDTLVSIGVLSSFLYSLYHMFPIEKPYLENLYFESTAFVIYFIKLGRILEGMSKDKTKEAIQNLVKITPQEAILKKDGKEKRVTIDEIKKKDLLISRPGEKMAVDGEIITGEAHFDESFITGESKPVFKKVGDKVVAGSINYDGYIEYEALKIGKESTISEMVRLVVEASNTKVPIAKIADTISGYFVPLVLCLAFLTALFYWILGFPLQEGINRFTTILIVACPCSLGLATPLAIIVAEGLCLQNGILVKKAEVLQTAKKINTVVFDKTGTLTYGKPKISEIKNKSELSKEVLLQKVGSLESLSNHPIANAFTSYLKEEKIEKKEVQEFESRIGLGITGKIEGERWILGNAKMLEKYGIKNPYRKEAASLLEQGNSIVYVASEEKILAFISIDDIVKENTKEVLLQLKEKQIEPVMLTGDHEKVALKIAEKIGIQKVIAEVLPSSKTQVIKKLKQEKKVVMMCGDGINDSPALATADIGLSMQSGTDIAMDSADVILMKEDLRGILQLIKISQRTVRNIKQNLFWAFFYNILMIPMAMGMFAPFGISLTPMLASIAMTFSSITVLLNALRLKKMNLASNKTIKNI